MSKPNIINVGYDSTNYYVVANTKPRLLVDVGMPGTLPKLQHQCKRAGVALTEIEYLLCTHYHPDHAGIAQELKQFGITLIICENQGFAIPMLAALLKPASNYIEIESTGNLALRFHDSRKFLASLSIPGEIIATPGHSDDIVSLVLDTGIAFTGDLPHLMMVGTASQNSVSESWQKIRAQNVKMVYPGHGPTYALAQIIAEGKQ
ncbi:MAG: MBL fold metallo-hydrolase [Chloroflexi bacterium]|nr:MBL fold metallo-hydrolase [Chloroflexota bacterium]